MPFYFIVFFSVYVAEIASKELRSSLSNVTNIAFCLGLVFTYSVSILVTWRTLAWFLMIPVFLAWVGLYKVPETPFWLAQKNRIDDALASLAWLRANDETAEEIKELKEKYKSPESETFMDKIRMKLKIAKSKSFWKPFLLAEPLNILYSCSGRKDVSFSVSTN